MSTKKSDQDTVEIPAVGFTSGVVAPHTGSTQVQVDLAAATHQGLVRPRNEDHYLVIRFSRTLETLLTSVPADQMPTRADEVGYGILVADGIGGAAGGELASRMAINTLIS